MTDRVHSLTVVLDQNYREDDVQTLVDAIKCLRGVLAVKKDVADHESYMAEERAKERYRDRVINALLDEGESNPFRR